MKEGFESYSYNGQPGIIKKDLSKDEREYWMKFKPDENTSRDPSQEEIIGESLSKHENIFGTQHTPTKIVENKNLAERYKTDIENRADTLYNLSNELESLVLLTKEHKDLSTFPSGIQILETVAAFVPLIEKSSEELTDEQLQSLSLPTKGDQIKYIIEKIQKSTPLEERDIEFLKQTAEDLSNLGVKIESVLHQKESRN